MRVVSRACHAAISANKKIGEMLNEESICGARRAGMGRIESLKLGEETLSESVLVHLSTYFSDVVEVVMFTRTVEARKTGADWLWCIDTPSGRYFMLVQAKRPEESMASGLRNWTINFSTKPNQFTSKTQHDTLVSAASKLGVTPSYCFFLPMLASPGCSFPIPIGLGTRWPYLSWIHLIPVSKVAVPKMSVDPIHPIGTSLTDMLCCKLQSGPSTTDASEIWPLEPMDIEFDELVDRISSDEEFSAIAGAVRFQVEGSHE
jgi:hypothetical protein